MNYKYVFKCFKDYSADSGLGYSYKKGQYVTHSGKPTDDINKAYLYKDNASLQEILEDDGLTEYFKVIKVIKTVTEVENE